MPRARFFCRTGELAGTEHWIGAEATIGRGPENTIVLPAGVVSKRHAHIVFDPAAGAYWIEDLSSRNGTLLDGARVEDRAHLSALHVITIGERHDFIFVVPSDRAVGATVDDRSGDGASQSATVHDPAPGLRVPRVTDTPGAGEPDEPGTVYGPPSVLRAPPLVGTTVPDRAEAGGGTPPNPATVLDAPSLVAAPPLAGGSDEPAPEGGPSAPATVMDPASALSAPPLTDAPSMDRQPATAPRLGMVVALPDGARRRISLPDGRYIVGRSHQCDIWIDDRTLSREHAVFVVRAGAVTVEDLSSSNGTFLDGWPVRASAPVQIGQPVTLGDRITAVVIRTDQS